MIERTPRQLTLAELIGRLPDVDLVLTEGYKRSRVKKIELHRAALGNPIISQPEELLAILTDEPLDLPVPQLSLEDVCGCADLILNWMQTEAGT